MRWAVNRALNDVNIAGRPKIGLYDNDSSNYVVAQFKFSSITNASSQEHSITMQKPHIHINTYMKLVRSNKSVLIYEERARRSFI